MKLSDEFDTTDSEEIIVFCEYVRQELGMIVEKTRLKLKLENWF